MKNYNRYSWLGLCLAMTSSAASAQTSSTGMVTVDIKSQPIGAALNELAQQSGVQVIFYSDVTDGIRAPAVAGTVTPDTALQELLSDSGLTYSYVNSRTVIVQPEGMASRSDPQARSNSAAPVMRLSQAQVGPAKATAASGAVARESASTDKVVPRGPEEEIVVTAQRGREEKLLDTPISVGVLSGQELDQGSSRGVADVLNQVPGVTLLEGQPGNTQISIRGVSAMAGTTTSAYYLDEVPFAFIINASLPDANAFDLARVEVLRGPQGTLYGANALSGVVRVLTNNADLDRQEFKGRVRVSGTEHGGTNYGGDAAINLPIIEGKLAVRGVVSHSEPSGYIDSTLDGRHDINDTEARAYRFRMNYQPTDKLNVNFGFSRSDIFNGAPASSLKDLTTPFSSNQPDERVYDTYNVVAQYDWDRVSLLSSSSYLTYDASTQIDQGFQYFNRYELDTFSQELRLLSHLPGAWQWSAGAYYQDSEDDTFQRAPELFPFNYGAKRTAESYAVFGELTRAFADGRVELTGGLRYYNSSTELSAVSDFFTGVSDLAPPESEDADKVTGRAVLNYRVTDEQMLYASISSGFRSGLPRSQAIAAIDSTFPAVKPDTLISYELGAKGNILEDAVTFTAAVYYQDWKDIQQTVTLPNTFTAFTNAGDAGGLGVEGSLEFHPTLALSLAASFGWNDLTFKQDVPSGTVILFREGDRINNSPEWTAAVSGNYRVETPVVGMSAVFSSNLTYKSPNSQRSKVGNGVVVSDSDPIYLWNASIGLERNEWALSLFGDNLLDEDGAISSGLTAGLDFINDVSLRPRPRTVGLQLTFSY